MTVRGGIGTWTTTTCLAVFGLGALGGGTPDDEVVVIHFDDFPDHTIITDQYSSSGVVFASAGPEGGPSTYSVFTSPVTAPNYLLGEYEGEDLNPGPEYGNNEVALPIDLLFVDPADPTRHATTTSVTFNEVFTNKNAVTRADAYNLAGELVATDEFLGVLSSASHILQVTWPRGIASVVVTFNAPGSTTAEFEDHAGIDRVEFPAVRPVPR